MLESIPFTVALSKVNYSLNNMDSNIQATKIGALLNSCRKEVSPLDTYISQSLQIEVSDASIAARAKLLLKKWKEVLSSGKRTNPLPLFPLFPFIVPTPHDSDVDPAPVASPPPKPPTPQPGQDKKPAKKAGPKEKEPVAPKSTPRPKSRLAAAPVSTPPIAPGLPRGVSAATSAALAPTPHPTPMDSDFGVEEPVEAQRGGCVVGGVVVPWTRAFTVKRRRQSLTVHPYVMLA